MIAYLVESIFGADFNRFILPISQLSSKTTMKSILKRPKDGDPELRGIRWDEDNIRSTEEQKDSSMKITEPKTPFIHYDETTDKAYTNGITPFELELAMSNLNHTNSQTSSRDLEDDDWSSDDELHLDERRHEKKNKFEKFRQEHYNMKQVLQRTKELIENEELDEHFNDPDYHDIPEIPDTLSCTENEND